MQATVLDERFQTEFDAVCGQGSQWLQNLRRTAAEHFSELGFPTTRQESWRFTNIKDITRLDLDGRVQARLFDPQQITQHLVENAIQLLFVNGVFQPEHSGTDDLPAGVTIAPLHRALDEYEDLILDHLNQAASYQGKPFSALNAALLEHGALVHIAKNTALDRPIQLIYINQAGEGEKTVMVNPRNLIVMEHHAEASLIETCLSDGDGVVFTNGVTEAILAEGARLSHSYQDYQNEHALHVRGIFAHLKRNAWLHSHNLLFGCKLIRNHIHVKLDGEGAEVEADGLYMGHGAQHHDNDIFIDHAKPHCNSKQFFKGILDDRSRAVFSGQVLVAKDAQKTDAQQSNKNLLLSDQARVDAKPQLEIYADDVKCAHGATTGHIDREAFFYLQTRGVNPDAARDLLVYAFAHEVIERLPVASIRHEAESFLYQRFDKARMIEET